MEGQKLLNSFIINKKSLNNYLKIIIQELLK